jgi:hypothetical protein
MAAPAKAPVAALWFAVVVGTQPAIARITAGRARNVVFILFSIFDLRHI